MSLPRIATVTTLKAPLHDTLSFVRYHLNSGINKMYLFFDDPQDPAIPYFSECNQVSCFRCNAEYWSETGIDGNATIQAKQKINATLALTQAQKSTIDWLIHIDSDELLFSRISFDELFSKIPKHTAVIRFPVLEALPQKIKYHDPFQEISLFKVHLGLKSTYQNFHIDEEDQDKQLRRAKNGYRRKKIYRLCCNDYCYRTFKTFLLGHKVGKAATHTSANIEYIGNHLPIPEKESKPRISISPDAYILHFDCQGYRRWKEKWTSRIDGSAKFETSRFTKQRNSLMQLFKEASIEGETALISLYKKLYFVSRYQKIMLYLTGAGTKIKLKKALFEPVDDH